MAGRRFRIPHTLVLLFGMIVAAVVLTYLLPAGSYQRVEHDGHAQVVPGTYARTAVPPAARATHRPARLPAAALSPSQYQAPEY